MHKVHLSQMLPVMEEMLNENGLVTFIPEGTSMLPVIVGGRDSVTIKKPSGMLKRYDACLYRRTNGDFVLHRVVGFENGSYTMSGDNQYFYEKGILPEQIIGLVVSVNKKGKEIDCGKPTYKFYVWIISCPFSKFFNKKLAAVKYRLAKLKK